MIFKYHVNTRIDIFISDPVERWHIGDCKLSKIIIEYRSVILVGYDFAVGSSADVLARLALLTAPLLYVCANIFARTKLGHYPPFVVAMMQMVGAVFVAFPLAIVIDQPWTLPMPSLKVVGAIVGMGLFGSALASLCHFTVLQRAGATNALLVTLIMPLTPIVLGGIFLGDRLTPRDMVGALIIAAALVIIDGRIFRRGRS